MNNNGVTCGIFTVLVIVSAMAVSAQSLQYNHDYICNGERVSVGHCRRDSDMAGFPRTTDAENFCMVYYLDRPKPGGFIVQKVELRNEVIQNLQKCGAFDPPSSGRPSTSGSSGVGNSSASESVAEFNKGGAGTAEYYFNEGNKLRDKKEYADAIDQYKKAIELKPSLALAHLNMGFCYFQMGDFKLAQERFQQAVWLDEKDATNQFWLGVTLMRLKQYKQALPVMQQAVKLDPSSPYNHYNLAAAYLYGPPDYQKAVQEYKEALRLKPDYNEVHNQLGLAYLWQNQYQAALTEFQTAIKLSGNKEPIHYQNVGLAYFRLGKKAEAMQIYEQLKAMDVVKAKELLNIINAKPPSKADALAKQAEEYYNAYEYIKAVEASKKALTLEPRNTEALGFLALSYRKMQKWDLAVAAFANYFAVQKPYYTGILIYGDTYEELKKYDKAIPLYRQALTLASSVQDKKDAYFKIGNAYYELDDYPKALDPYLQVTLLSPTDDDALFHLGMCYMFIGKKAEAQQVQKRLELVNKYSGGVLQGRIDWMK
jgi:tetratricopeptide (TPR) repeat protein